MAVDPQVMVAVGIGGGKNMSIASVKGPLSYTTGGVLVSAKTVNLDRVDWLSPMDLSTDGLNFVRVISTPIGGGASSVKFLWFVASTGAEVAPGTNLSTKRIMVHAIGT